MMHQAHGIEVLLRKASVDPEFRNTLLQQRGRAAEEIGLELTPAEVTILTTVPEADLVRMIDKIEVPEAHRSAFMGRAAAVMLAIVVGAGLVATCVQMIPTAGISPRKESGEDESELSEPGVGNGSGEDAVNPGPTRGIRADPVEPRKEPGDGK